MSKIFKSKLGSISIVLAVFIVLSGPSLFASTITSGWIYPSSFSGSVENECNSMFAVVWGQAGRSFSVTPNIPAGNYKVDIEAYYGFYRQDPQAPQPNETMRIRTSVDAKTVSDLNGNGGMREDRDSCSQINSGRVVYFNITNSPIRYEGGSVVFEGLTGESQSIDIYRVRF